LGAFTEGGLETNNKFLRFYRQHLSRKINQTFNLEDCITWLWLRSDPLIRDEQPKSHCKKFNSSSHYTVSCHKQRS
jgi:hypothetical protein